MQRPRSLPSLRAFHPGPICSEFSFVGPIQAVLAAGQSAGHEARGRAAGEGEGGAAAAAIGMRIAGRDEHGKARHFDMQVGSIRRLLGLSWLT